MESPLRLRSVLFNIFRNLANLAFHFLEINFVRTIVELVKKLACGQRTPLLGVEIAGKRRFDFLSMSVYAFRLDWLSAIGFIGKFGKLWSNCLLVNQL